MPYLRGKRNPRAARRARKPLQDSWRRVAKGVWLKCTYEKCGYEWQYFGGRSWAACPACHSTMKVAVARRNFLSSASSGKEASGLEQGRRRQ